MHARKGLAAAGLAIAALTASTLFAADQAADQSKAARTATSASRRAAVPTAQRAKYKPAPLRHGVFRWTSYPAAWTAAQKTNRPILLYVTAPACPHCVKMIAETYKSPKISPLVAESFETVYVDRAEQPEMVAKLKVRWFPTTIIVGTNNKVVDVLEGYVEPQAFAQRIKTGLAAANSPTRTR